jgi:hypothetical protein
MNWTGHSKAAGLLSILMITSLLVPLLVFATTVEVRSPPSEIAASASLLETVVSGGPNGVNVNTYPPPIELQYKAGDYPPILMAENLQAGGRVAAAGIIYGCRGVYTSGTASGHLQPYYFRPGETDNLFNAIFQWLKPGAESVLWYQGHSVYARNKITQDSNDDGNPGISALADNLVVTWGYNINKCNGHTGPDAYQDVNSDITAGLLSEYDILVLPELGVGDWLSNDENAAIVTWVRTGGGLLILDSSDHFAATCDAAQTNDILHALGATFRAQDDQVNRSDLPTSSNWYFEAPVDTSTGIGAIYGSPTVHVSSTNSLRIYKRSVSVALPIDDRSGVPGTTLEYSVTVTNGWDNPDNFTLSVNDDSGWTLVVNPLEVSLDGHASDNTLRMSVTIPAGTTLGTIDTITVTATSKENSSVTDSKNCSARAALALLPFDDAYVRDDNADGNYGDLYNMYVGRYLAVAENTFLKFNLTNIPNNATIQEARIYLWCWYTYSSTIVGVYPVNNDDWSEFTITWNNAPSFDINATPLDSQVISLANTEYYFDVKSFVVEQFAGDKEASFALAAPADSPQSRNLSFDAKEWPYDNAQHPYLEVVYTLPENVPKGVDVSISPSSKDGAPGATLTYTVTVANTGSEADSYSLTVSDNAGWGPTLSGSSISNLDSDTSQTVTLTVTIPSTADNGARDNITVTATSQTDNTVSDSDSCVAHSVEIVTVGGVQVLISPISQSGKTGETLNFSITVTNTGSSTDTFALTTTDTNSWGSTLSISSTTLAPGDSRTGIRLSITIPSTAAVGDSSTITVTATSQTISTVSAENTCTATASGTSPTSGGISTMVILVVVIVVIVVIIGVVLVIIH